MTSEHRGSDRAPEAEEALAGAHRGFPVIKTRWSFPMGKPVNQWVRYSEIGGFRVTQPLQITTVTAPVRHQALGVGPPALRPLLGMFWSNNVCAAQGKRQLDEHPQLFFLGTWVHWVRKSPNWCYPYNLYILYCKTMDMKHF